MALAVHPRFGEEVSVVALYGRSGVWAETLDGTLRLFPLTWTSLHPRPGPLEVDGQTVRLSPEALRALSAWVGVRVDVEGLDPTDREDQKRGDDVGDELRARAEVATVVGQAGSPGLRRRARLSRERGKQ